MSKAKKLVYAEKQKVAAQAAANRLTPLGETNPSPAPEKAKARKQSRGK